MAIIGPEAKPCRLDPSCPTERLFTDRVDNVLLTQIMQFLEAADVLHLAKTCKRFASRYLAKLPDLRHYDEFAELSMQLKDSTSCTSELILAASGQASWRRFHIVDFCNKKPLHENVDLRVSDKDTLVLVTFRRFRQCPVDDQQDELFTQWKCFVQNGTHVQAFIILAEYVSKRFAFEKLHLMKFCLKTSEALSKLPFVVRHKLELSGSLDEESLLRWYNVSPSASLAITLDAKRNLGREVFDDTRRAMRKEFALRFRDGQFETESQVLYEHLESWMGKMKRFELLNTESYITYDDLKRLIEKWMVSEELEVELWSFAMAVEEGVTLGSIFVNLQDSFRVSGGLLCEKLKYFWLTIIRQADRCRTLRMEFKAHRQQCEATILMVYLFDESLTIRRPLSPWSDPLWTNQE